MAGVDNIPDFFDGEKPNAEKFNLLRNAILQQFTGGIVSTSLQWPLVAYGTLDMNNNPITNIGSLNNVIHVNSSKSLPEAITEVNAGAGNSVVVVDPNFVATTSAVQQVISVPNVTLMGFGNTSTISCDAVGTPGIKATAVGFKMKGLRLTGLTSTIGVMLEAGQFDVRGCLFEGMNVALQLGSGSNACHNGWAVYNHFEDCETGVWYGNAYSAHVDYNTFNECDGDMVYLQANNEFLQDITINGNVGYASAAMASGNGIYGTMATASAKKRGLTVSGNFLSCEAVGAKAIDIGQMTSSTIKANYVHDGTCYLEGSNNEFNGNIIAADADFIFDENRVDCSIRNNRFVGATVLDAAQSGVDKFGVIAGNSFQQDTTLRAGIVLSQFRDNRVTGDLIGLLSEAGIRMYYGNDVTGTVS